MQPQARKLIEERPSFGRATCEMLLNGFDSVWQGAPVKEEGVAQAIAEAICVLAEAGQSSQAQLDYQAGLVIGLPYRV